MSVEKFQRISLAVSYQAENLLRRKAAVRPPAAPQSQFGILNGKVIDRRSGLPLDAQISRSSGEKSVADQQGAFSFDPIRPGKQVLIVEKDGYVPQTVETDVAAGSTAYVEVQLEPEVIAAPMPPLLPIAAAPLPAPKPKLVELKLAPIYFAFDQSLISPEAAAILRDHAQTLKATPDVRITILGFTDEVGTEQYNLKLGERRARTVFDYLQSLGVGPAQMSCRSMGRVLAPAQPRWSNRRCDFRSQVK
jgi:outer membrane protein OmpA-like peptidoglycan-associated protein